MTLDLFQNERMKLQTMTQIFVSLNDLRAQLVTLIVLSNAVKKITVLLFNHRLGRIWNNVTRYETNINLLIMIW